MTISKHEIPEIVKQEIQNTKITDIHTHLYAPHFQNLLLLGPDELLTYHYLIAETFRFSDVSFEQFWKMTKTEQADLIWQTLFIENSPLSEASRGVVTTFKKLGIDLSERDLSHYRSKLENTSPSDYVAQVFDLSGIDSVVMTNDPFDSEEREIWLEQGNNDPRFHAALRIDPLINEYETVYQKLNQWGYDVEQTLTQNTIRELQRFIKDWAERMNALYIAVSLPDTFVFPDESLRSTLIQEVILPVCEERNCPFALMIGVKRQVNPKLKSAGDSVGKSDIRSIENLCKSYPSNKFMVTMLSRENQHELAVTARKFRNLMVFGCWWFLNNPSLIDEITSLRFELLGASFIPQHSDARILDQLIYKWEHSRHSITEVLVRCYSALVDAGWHLEKDEVERDVKKLFRDNFWRFIRLKL